MFKNIGNLFLLSCLSAFISMPLFGASEYTGTVTPIKVIEHGAGNNAYFYGSLDYVARIGEIALPSITDADGNVVKQGTNLFSLHMKYWIEQRKGAQDQMDAAGIMVKEAKKNLERYQILVKPGAASEEVYEGYIAAYATALSNFRNYQGNVIQYDEFLKQARAFVSPFEGIITKVMYSQGVTAENENTVEITQLNPIGISIKMSREEARKIGMNKHVKVFPLGSDNPQGILYGRSIVTDEGITFQTRNTPAISKEDANLRIVRDVFPVFNFSNTDMDSKLAVPQNAILNDASGTFVWLADNSQAMIPGKGTNNQLKIEKVYIKLAGFNRLITGFSKVEALSDPGKIKLYDIVINNPPADLKDGETICFPQERYVMMPGDQVKVIIGN